MAVTEVDLDFTYSYDSILEFAGEGTETNPSTQNLLDYDDTLASSMYGLSMGNQLATAPTFNGSGSAVNIGLELALQTLSTGSLGPDTQDALEISMEGSLVVRNAMVGGALSVLQVRASGSMYASKGMYGDASVVKITMDGSGFVSNNLSMDKEAVILSLDGYLIQNALVTPVTDPDTGITTPVITPIVIPAEDDAEYPNISGEEYIVVNLRTKAHSTYRDGERTAFAKTASMELGSTTEKNVSDLFLHSRARGEMEVLVSTGEDIERRYPLTHGDTTQASLKNKKLQLAKGLKGTNWTLSVIVPDESHLEIKAIKLLVTDIKRH